MRSEWIDDKWGAEFLVGNPRTVAMEDGNRGVIVRTTVPRTERIFGSTSGSSSLNASWRIDRYSESRVVFVLSLVFPSRIVLSRC